LIPAFDFFSGQFALIAIAAATVCAGIFVATRDQLASLRRVGLPEAWCLTLAAAFFVAFAGNRYTLRILSSAHFEPVFVLAAALLLSSTRKGSGYRRLVPLLLLALGVRQDAGFFLFFLLVSCLFAPKAWGTIPRQRILVLAGIAVAYVGFASMVIMPWLGNDGGTRFWHEWGESWPQVFLAWARAPERVLSAVQASDFESFNAELTYLQVLNPLAWFANQAPGILFYTADAPDKIHLEFYNSAFLLPGLMLCFAFAQLHATTFIHRTTAAHRRLRHLGMVAVSVVFAYAAVEAAIRLPRGEAETLSVDGLERHDPFALAPLRDLMKCSGVHSVAADFRSIVYAPLRSDKYLLPNALRADVVVVQHHIDKHEPFAVKRSRLIRDLTRGGRYLLAASSADYDVYMGTTIACHLQASH
jgi:hypothetical protein